MNRLALAAAAAVSTVMLVAQPAMAADASGRISEIESTPTQVTFILSGEGLATGQNIDPASVVTTLDGATVPSSVVFTDGTSTTQTVILAIDTSGSMLTDDRIGTAKVAARQFLTGLPAEVKVGMVSFADDAKVLVAPTTDRAKVLTGINGLTATGSTALNDAVLLSTNTLGSEGSRSIVVLSDGKDEDSNATAKEAQTALAQSGVVLDAVSIGDGTTELQAFATVGNGSVVTAGDSVALTTAFQQIAQSVTTQLTVTADVPAGTAAGTVNLGVTAKAGDVPLSDTAAATLVAAPVADEGPAAAQSSGLLSKPWMPWAIAALIFAGLLGIAVYAVGALNPQGRKTGRIARRLAETEPATIKEKAESTTSLGDSQTIRTVVSFADRVAATRDMTTLASKLEAAGLGLRPGEWVVIHGLVAVIAVTVTALLTNLSGLWMLVAIAVGAMGPWVVLNHRGKKRRKEFYAALPDAMQMLSGSLLAGYSLPQALDTVAKETKGVLGDEVGRALLESRLGIPIEEALEAVAQRMDSTDFHWVVMAIGINRRVGGNLAEVLAQVGKTLRERERLRRQVKTLAAEGMMSAWVIGIIPVALLGFMLLRDPHYLEPLLSSATGLMIIVAGVSAYVFGIMWLRKTVKMEV